MLKLDNAAKDTLASNASPLAADRSLTPYQIDPSVIQSDKTKYTIQTVSSSPPVVSHKIDSINLPQSIYKHSVKNTLFGTYVCESNDLTQNQPEDEELRAFGNWLIQERG